LITVRRGAKTLALIAAASIPLAACAASDSGDGGGAASSSGPAATTFTWAYEQEFYAYNLNTAAGNASSNAVVLNQVLPGFWQYDATGEVAPVTEFGTFEKTADTPLTVKYTLNPKAAWSDGEQIDCDDIVLGWVARSGKSGKKGFDVGAVPGYQTMQKPQCKEGEKAFTTVYDKPFADWRSMFGPGEIMPAHVVEKQASVSDIIAAADDPTGADVLKAAKFYNTAWALNPGELKPDIMPSAGPYTIAKWDAGQSLTLEANPKWWGTPPKTKTIVIRYIAPNAQAQALQNGEVNAMNPQPQVDLAKQINALGDQVTQKPGDQFTFEHIDYNVAGKFKDRDLREAFTKCLPREQIVNNLVKPVNPKAKLMDSRFIFPFQSEYAQYATGLGGEAYTKVDIPGAKALVEKASPGKKVSVRLGWLKNPDALNKRRQDTVALIQASCSQAGFDVKDAGKADFFGKAWPAGDFEVAMFAWAGSTLVTGSYVNYITDGGQNPQKYSNPTVDKLLNQLNEELDLDKQAELLKQIDAEMWKDLNTIPLFGFPIILAHSTNAQGVQLNPTQADLTWNAHQWALS
jgi:peptide/nickel transport system substrate-binding protein